MELFELQVQGNKNIQAEGIKKSLFYTPFKATITTKRSKARNLLNDL